MSRKLELEGIYTGDIYRISKACEFVSKRDSIRIIPHETSLYKKCALLLQILDHSFVDVDTVKNFYEFIYIYNYLRSFDYVSVDQNKIISDLYGYTKEGLLYVEKSSLVPYDSNLEGEISYKEIKQLKYRYNKEKKEQ